MKNWLLPFDRREDILAVADAMFNELVKEQFPSTGLSIQGSFPKTNITEYLDKVRLISEIAGLSKEDIEINIENDSLSISGSRKKDEKDEGVVIWRELKHSNFKRTFTFGDKFDLSKIDASFNNGVLTIDIAKKTPEVQISKKVEIK